MLTAVEADNVVSGSVAGNRVPLCMPGVIPPGGDCRKGLREVAMPTAYGQ